MLEILNQLVIQVIYISPDSENKNDNNAYIISNHIEGSGIYFNRAAQLSEVHVGLNQNNHFGIRYATESSIRYDFEYWR